MINIAALTTAAATSSAVQWYGGDGVVEVDGTWGGGTLTMNFRGTPGGTFKAVGSGFSMTANGTKGFKLPAGELQFVLSGSTGATVNVAYGSTLMR